MPFTFNAIDLYVLTFSGNPRIPLEKCAGHCRQSTGEKKDDNAFIKGN